MTWVIVLLVVALIVVAGALVMERWRSAALRARFGPEYERAVEAHGDRRGAEAALRTRVKQRAEIDLREMTPAVVEPLVREWRTVQSSFVDEPRASVSAAEALVERAMTVRGYPTTVADDGGDRLDLVAVDHGDLVGGYRKARSAVHRDGGDAEEVSLDDLRQVFLRYRALFDALVDRRAETRRPVGFARRDGGS
ncbi:MAG TPA: hypothetical protein VFI47_20055 [Acidimicrobiales bacterium]|nr:hypothetical protein [Acidimicrobiales bacterium]